MALVRVVFLWHMHQPFYKDLASGEYRLPWVRMHGLKDYFGMVKLLEEFPFAHQTFNLVPSLITQLQDYAAGTARDPFLDLVAKPAPDLTPSERLFALRYLFQANPVHMIRRYPRYAELWDRVCAEGSEGAERSFKAQDFTDLQVLSQVAWFDEYFLQEPEVAELVQKEREFTAEDQEFAVKVQQKFLARILPEYTVAAQRGSIEISTSPFYHPILPLLCDTSVGRASSPGLSLPQERFRRPEDAREQIQRALDLHERLFGARPRGMWPSEGSVSEETIHIGHELGLQWMATDEGVLGRSESAYFPRDVDGRLMPPDAARLYQVYRYEKAGRSMNLLFRDHIISDLIGFVYSGMEPARAAEHFIRSIKESTEALVSAGDNATVSVILDGENAWEHFPRSGREFLKRLYSAVGNDGFEMVTASEAVNREPGPGSLQSLVPGSWINANFNVWIGAPEDNRSWDYLKSARDFFDQNAASAPLAQKELAWEELLIAEGSDWNWWYGPEHHSANDGDFDELYRQHLSNVYRALDAAPPHYLAQPIFQAVPLRSPLIPQTSYIHPVIDGDNTRYFDWIGSAMLTADTRDSAMHGRQFILKALYAGIDEKRLYVRIDFEKLPAEDLAITVHLEYLSPEQSTPVIRQKLNAAISNGRLCEWNIVAAAPPEGLTFSEPKISLEKESIEVCLGKVFELSTCLGHFAAAHGGTIRLRAVLLRNELPVDLIPADGWFDLPVLAEEKMTEFA